MGGDPGVVQALEALGAEVEMEHGYVIARAAHLTGARILLELASDAAREHCTLVVSEWPPGDARRHVLEASIAGGTTALQFATTTDEALEAAVTLSARLPGLLPASAPRVERLSNLFSWRENCDDCARAADPSSF
mgnify:CR=1 FL=1